MSFPCAAAVYNFSATLYNILYMKGRVHMVTAVSYTSFRKSLKSHMRQVNEDADMLLVTNTDPADNVVVMSAADYDSLMETVRIYENPYLRDKVIRGLDQASKGRVSSHDLLGPEPS